MMELLRYVDARLGEASTWSAIATFLLAMHVNIDPGVMHAITIWGTGASAALAFMIAEKGAGKTSSQMAQDILDALVASTNKGAKQ